jgi:Tfp pilus assembly protein PilF
LLLHFGKWLSDFATVKKTQKKQYKLRTQLAAEYIRTGDLDSANVLLIKL